MSYDAEKVAFIDTETTGLDPERHAVWEIAVIVNGEEHCWQQFLTRKQRQGADQWVRENTRFDSDYESSTALALTDSLERLGELTRGRHLVGACPWFDSERLHRAWLNAFGAFSRALPWHYHLIDIENLVVGYMRGQYSDQPDTEGPTKWDLPWTSDDLSRFVGVDPADYEPKHSALTDARWAEAVFEAVMGRPS
jgi:hypothetical protein